MRTKVYLSVIVFALLCVVGWTAYGQRQGAGRVAWEYKTFDLQYTEISQQEVRRLNDLGEQGWELVAIIHNEDTHQLTRYVLKRAK